MRFVSLLLIPVLAVPPPGAPALRVCADPGNLPFSDRAEAGYENRIALLLARDMGVTAQFVWVPLARGFVRKTLNAGLCDVIMGVPAHYDPVRTTAPYYRTTYVFVYRRDRGLHLTTLDDTALAHLRIGIPIFGDDYANPPPAQALAARGIVSRVVGYPIAGEPSPARRLIEAVARGRVDVAVAWGPTAGYFARRQSVALEIVPLPDGPDPSGQIFAFDIAIGVRNRDSTLERRLDSLLTRERSTIHHILHDYGVPLCDSL